MDSDGPLPLLILGLALLGFFIVCALWAAFGLAGKYAGPPWPEAQAPTRATQRLVSRYERTALLIATLRIAFLLVASVSGASWILAQGLRVWLSAVVLVLGLLVVFAILQGIAMSLGHRYAKRTLLAAAPIIVWSEHLFAPLLWVAERVGVAALKWRVEESNDTNNGALPAEQDEPDELPVEEVREAKPDERRMIQAILELEEVAAREVMVPRVDIVAVSVDTPLSGVAGRMAEAGHSRLPVFQDSIDTIIGVVHSRDVLQEITTRRDTVSLRDIVRPPLFVPDSKAIDQLLKELREQRVSIAVVVDEYGGVEGILTIEDLLEEIVGEIEDEFQKDGPSIVRISEREAIVDGHVNVEQLNDLFKMSLEGEGFDTVGGLVSSCLGRIPNPGDAVTVDGLSLRVLSTHGRRVRKVRAMRNTEVTTA